MIRKLNKKDYNSNYINLMQKFSNFKTKISKEYFESYIDRLGNNVKIYVIVKDNSIIGSATIFLLEKIHNNINKIGFIQDVFIDEIHRGNKYGKKLIKYICEKYKNECYKIILNCNDDVIPFYKKIGFYQKGFEFEKRS